jgi:hypothetical protein
MTGEVRDILSSLEIRGTVHVIAALNETLRRLIGIGGLPQF